MSKKKKGEGSDSSLILRNKKAFHDYEVLETLECGIVLVGTEAKSLRGGRVNFCQAYATIDKGKLFLLGVNIGLYEMGNRMNHDPDRKRTLLAHKREIRKLALRVEQKGLTLVPLKLYWKRGMCKVELGIVRGKQVHDKRDTARDRDIKLQIDRDLAARR